MDWFDWKDTLQDQGLFMNWVTTVSVTNFFSNLVYLMNSSLLTKYPYITHNAIQLWTVQLEIGVCYACGG